MDGRPLFAAVVDVIFADFPDVTIVEGCDFELTCEERLALSGTSITAEVSTSGTTLRFHSAATSASAWDPGTLSHEHD